jgi:hypothetical protein
MSHLFPEVLQKQTAAAVASHGIFASIGNAPLVENPYPHLVVEEALPRAIADVLLAEMPPLDVVLQGQERGSNVRFTLPSPLALSNPRISDTWKDAIRACLDASQDYLDLTLKRFGAHLTELFPDFETRFGPIDELRAVPRYGPRAHNEVGMDAQIVVNSPPLTDGTSVRGPHLDIPNKLISALLYLRPEHDDSIGGELDLYEPAGCPLLFVDGNAAAPGTVRRVLSYPYRHNLMILPLVTPLGVHGVSPRAKTTWPRYHLHIVGEMADMLFDIPYAEHLRGESECC